MAVLRRSWRACEGGVVCLVRARVRVPAHAVLRALAFARGPFAQTTTGRGIAGSHGHSKAARRAPADRGVVAPRVVRRRELRVTHRVRRAVGAAGARRRVLGAMQPWPVNIATGNRRCGVVDVLPRGARRQADRVRTKLRAARRPSSGARPIFSNASGCTNTHVAALRSAAGANAARKDSTVATSRRACIWSSAFIFSPKRKRCDDMSSHATALARTSCREAWGRANAHARRHCPTCMPFMCKSLPSLRLIRFGCGFMDHFCRLASIKSNQRIPTSPKSGELAVRFGGIAQGQSDRFACDRPHAIYGSGLQPRVQIPLPPLRIFFLVSGGVDVVFGVWVCFFGVCVFFFVWYVVFFVCSVKKRETGRWKM